MCCATIERAGTQWELARTVWEGGETDDEGLMRICAPETFRGRGQYLRDDLTRMIREYRDGRRECAVPSATRSEAHVEAPATARAREPESISTKELRKELTPVLDAVHAYTRKFDEIAPHFAADRRKAQLAWIQKADGLSEVERKAALLATEGMSMSEIAKRLPHREGKPMSREGVRKALLRFERKTGQPGLFSKGTYRQNQRVEAEARQDEEEGER